MARCRCGLVEGAWALDRLALHAEGAGVGGECDSNALTRSFTLAVLAAGRAGAEACGVRDGKSGDTMTGLSLARFVVSGVIDGVSDTLDARNLAPTGDSASASLGVSCSSSTSCSGAAPDHNSGFHTTSPGVSLVHRIDCFARCNVARSQQCRLRG